MKTPAEYYIVGRPSGIDLSFWNLDKGWVTEFAEGSPFTEEILTLPLPEGAVAVIAFSSDSEPVAQFNPFPSGEGNNINFFSKVY
jgi:hypothetical protein